MENKVNERIKERITAVAAVFGFIIAGVLLWEVIRAVMWMCYVAGIPM